MEMEEAIEAAERPASRGATVASTAAVAVDAPPPSVSHQDAANAVRRDAIDAIPDWKRVAAVDSDLSFVMSSGWFFTRTGPPYLLGNENTDWKVTA